jgi:hypothetical protein
MVPSPGGCLGFGLAGRRDSSSRVTKKGGRPRNKVVSLSVIMFVVIREEKSELTAKGVWNE